MANFRSIAERIHDGAADPNDAKAQQRITHAKQDYENAILFLRSQREHAVSFYFAYPFNMLTLDDAFCDFFQSVAPAGAIQPHI